MRSVVAALSLLFLFGCGGDDGGDASPAPCGGLCPASECFAGACIGGDTGNNGADTGTDAPDGSDTPDTDIDTGDVDMDADAADLPDDADTSDAPDAPDAPDTPDVPADCTTADDCDDGEMCEDGECVVVCIADDREPNDDADTDPVAVPARRSFELLNLTACPGDSDWFPVALADAREQLSASVSLGDAQADVELEILSTDGSTVLAAAEGGGARRSASIAAPAAGTYFARVTAGSQVGRAGVDYTLTLTRTNADDCAPDGFEPNESADDATELVAGSHEARLCRNDVDSDWYEFEVAVGDEVSVSLQYDHAVIAPNDDLGGLVYGPDGDDDLRDFLIRDGDSDTDRLASGVFVAGQADEGTWKLQVDSLTDGDPVDYTVHLGLEGRPLECGVDDPSEPNNNCGEAEPLALLTSVDGYMCGPSMDEDWFSVTVADGQELTVTMEHFHFEGNLELEVYDPNEGLAGLSYNAGPDVEVVVIEGTDGGEYCVRIFGRSGLTENSYTVAAEAR